MLRDFMQKLLNDEVVIIDKENDEVTIEIFLDNENGKFYMNYLSNPSSTGDDRYKQDEISDVRALGLLQQMIMNKYLQQ